MRTTLTLDADVARLINEAVHRGRRPAKQVINEAIRRGLSPRGRRPATKPYKVIPHTAKLRAGLDRAAFNRLADDLEIDARAETLSPRR